MGRRKQSNQKQNQPGNTNVWSPTVVVAIIGAIGLIVVALINRSTSIATTLKPIEATQTAEAQHTAIAMTAQAYSPNITNTSVLLQNLTPTLTQTIISSLTSTSTSFPTITSTPTIPPLLRTSCFDENIWTPYEKDSSIKKDNGCWNLNPWGFSATDNEIIIVPPNSSDGEFHGIYTPIQNNSEISFKIRVNKFDVDPGVTANIGIGIINLDPPGPAASRLVFYHYIPKDSVYYIPMQTGVDAHYKDLIPITLKFLTPQKVTLKVNGPFLTIVFDDNTEVNLTIPFEKRAFWVSYSIPPSSELIMSIYDLEIK